MTDKQTSNSVTAPGPSLVFGLAADYAAADTREVLEPLTGKVAFVIRRYGHPEFTNAIRRQPLNDFTVKAEEAMIAAAAKFPNSEKRRRAYITAQTKGLTLIGEDADEKTTKAVAEHGIVATRGLTVQNEEGKLEPVEYTPELGMALLTDPSPLLPSHVIAGWEAAGMLGQPDDDGVLPEEEVKAGKRHPDAAREMTLGKFLTMWVVFESQQTELYRAAVLGDAVEGLADGSGGN